MCLNSLMISKRRRALLRVKAQFLPTYLSKYLRKGGKGVRRNGFTLVELMVTVAIVAILAAIAIPNFLSAIRRAKEAGVKSNAHTVHLVAESFMVMAGRYPGSIGTTVGQVIGGTDDHSITGGDDIKTPPFPSNALLCPHKGYKNPFDETEPGIDTGPTPTDPVLGCVYYWGLTEVGGDPISSGEGGFFYQIEGVGSQGDVIISLPKR